MYTTWELIQQELGFEPDDRVWSDLHPGLSLNFGNFKLSASAVLSMQFRPVVLFTGIYATARVLADVQFELPRQIPSRELLMAFLAHYLDKAAGHPCFHPERGGEWLNEGRLHSHLLPWEVDRVKRAQAAAEYAARPNCSVERDWLKLAFKKLREDFEAKTTEGPIQVDFDGQTLVFRHGDKPVRVAGEGKPWPMPIYIPADSLQNLPKRLLNEHVDVSLWKGSLHIDHRHRFEGLHAGGPVPAGGLLPLSDATNPVV